MTKTLYVLPLLLASGLLAAPEADALTLDNGRNINGRNMNGRTVNGLSFNGRNMNGLSLNGVVREEAVGHATAVILKDGERVTLN